MPVRIEVTVCNGAPPIAPIAAEFDELGGSIGRGEASTLMLPDPARLISRTHAVVLYRNGGYVVRDQGSATPVLINGTAIGNGNEAPLVHGDELCVGGYTLRVELCNGVDADLTDFNRPAQGGSAVPVSPDPFADLADLMPPAAPNPIASPDGFSGAAARPPVAGVIPADFDPFGEPASATPPSTNLPDDVDLGFENPAGRNSIDDLFDLGAPVGRDPLQPEGPAADRGVDSVGNPTSTDPLAAFERSGAEPRGFQPVQRDDTPELHRAFVPPRVRPETRTAARDARTPPEPVGSTHAERASPVDPPQQAARQAEGRATDELLRAFLDGAGMPDLDLPDGLTPQRMHLLGTLVREAAQGTLDLLLARALTKREVRADATMIVARENNPLKFSPNVEVALQHLLAPGERGFMDPASALRDAYDDLRSHQFGFMAGMRAALAGVLRRFDPATLEQRLKEPRMLDSLVPLHRKSRLWDLFSELYGAISKEAEDDFHTLFGREFLRAYQAQIAKLRQDKSGSS